MKATITVKGRFTTGDSWTEQANNKQELKWVLEQVSANQAINSDSIEIIKDGEVIWRALGGFTDAPHPKYMEALLGPAPARSEAQRQSDARYREKLRQISLKINSETESDILQRLEDVPNIAQYIKTLILRDIAAEIASRRPMADHPEDAWTKEAEVPASPAQMATRNGRRQALEGYADYFENMSDEDIDEEIRQGFIEICSDGMIIWVDG